MFSSGTAGGRTRRTIQTLAEAASLASKIVALAPVVVASAAAGYGALVGNKMLAMFALGVLVALLAVVGSAFVGTPAIRRIVWGYRITRLEVIDDVDERDPSVHRRRTRMDVKTVRAGLRSIWNGYGSRTPDGRGPEAHAPCATSTGHECGVPREEAERWMFLIFFDGPQPMGKILNVAFEQDIYESPCALRSWVAKAVVDPIDQLVIRVRIPAVTWPTDLEGQQIVPGQDRPSILPVEIEPGDGEARLIVRRPVVGREYRIGWTRRRLDVDSDGGDIRASDVRSPATVPADP
jgi:hypothetical protein